MKDGLNDVNEFWAGFRKTVIKYGVLESEPFIYF